MGTYATLSEAIDQAVREGYGYNFIAENGGLRCIETGDTFLPRDAAVVRHERFEGPSSADDEETLYYIETSTGLRGTLVDAYGAYASEAVGDFLRAAQAQTR